MPLMEIENDERRANIRLCVYVSAEFCSRKGVCLYMLVSNRIQIPHSCTDTGKWGGVEPERKFGGIENIDRT
jgi:hypothetical protein